MYNRQLSVCTVIVALILLTASARADIFQSAEQGNLDSVKTQLNENPQLLTATDNGGYTVLHKAAYNNRADVVRYLIESGADINATSGSGSTPLHGAAFGGHLQALQILLDSGADFSIKNASGFTPLLSACAGGRAEAAQLLINAGANVLDATSFGWTNLMYAANSGDTGLCRLLIEKGCDVNATAPDGSSPLSRALWNASANAVELLVNAGADVDAQTADSLTQLYFAVAYRDPTISDIMIDKGTVFDIKNDLQMTMLHYAAALGSLSQARKIVASGVDVNARCINGKTALYYATIWGHDEVADFLRQNGAVESSDTPLVPDGDYFGQARPGPTPEVFAQNMLLTPFAPHGIIAFSPDGSEVLWCHHAMPIQAMWYMRQDNGVWSRPRIAPFTDPATEYFDGSPSFSQDGKTVYYHSHRARTKGGERTEDSDIWYVRKAADGWGEPVNVGAPVNTDKDEHAPCVAASGSIYFIGADYEDSHGAGDIYVSEFAGGKYSAPRNLGATVNSPYHELGPAVAADESYLIFASNRPDLFGQDLKLFASFRKPNNTWTEAINLGRPINSGHTWMPSISGDGDFIFYQQGDQYRWFSAELVKELREAMVPVVPAGHENIAKPVLRLSDQRFEPSHTFQIALGDLDADGDLDAVFANMRFIDSRVYLNDGSGRFTVTEQRLTQQGHGVDLGDLDGDGDLDIFITCAGFGENNVEHHRPSKVYLNDGKANFVDAGENFGDSLASGNAAMLHDIDGDGDLDAMVVYYQDSNRVYTNDGSGHFSLSPMTFPEHSEWADLDGDGDIDLFVRESSGGFKTLLNDGKGNFSEHWSLADTTVVRGRTAFGDLDGDGDLDAVITSGGNTQCRRSAVWFNDGSGRFADSGSELPITRWARLDLGDLNGDGHIDAFVNNFDLPEYVWLNDGAGRLFESGMRLGPAESRPGSVSVADLDGDGDMDIFISNFGDGSSEIWFNE